MQHKWSWPSTVCKPSDVGACHLQVGPPQFDQQAGRSCKTTSLADPILMRTADIASEMCFRAVAQRVRYPAPKVHLVDV